MLWYDWDGDGVLTFEELRDAAALWPATRPWDFAWWDVLPNGAVNVAEWTVGYNLLSDAMLVNQSDFLARCGACAYGWPAVTC